MEKAILKTLIYSDIFDFPLKAWEIHKWLIGKRATLQQIEKSLKGLSQKSKVKSQNDFYFLRNKKKLVEGRERREKVSEKHFKSAKFYAGFLRIIPWIKLVGVSGSLAMKNSRKSDDIDLFIITGKNRLWLSRILILLIFELLGKRRKRGENLQKVSGKLCTNILLEEDNLAQTSKNIYLVHEVLQMRVLWEKEGIYHKFLSDNDWVFKHLPNWATSTSIKYRVLSIKQKKHDASNGLLNTIINSLEDWSRVFQLRYMGNPQGLEKVSEASLYLHPQDKSIKILKEYKVRCGKLEVRTGILK